ncbi:MAG: radical SAM protein [Candidatus Eisenbacteria bacterium]|nr:radical SAM protein [Candidatus Latescibacterota bacterium]MBD3302704.1 radical SAM protein [Candidatus Eisenbacteria bacterium]
MRGQATIPGLDPGPSRPLPRRVRGTSSPLPPVWTAARTQYRPLPCATILNRNRNGQHPFTWTINPYRGCRFGCPFCYARYTHEYLDHRDPTSFSERIYVKFQAPQVLAETLTPEVLQAGPIAIGTATDPYQPAEKRFRITRRILEVLCDRPGLELSITTRSPLILRDLDLLQRIGRSGRIHVNVSLITRNPSLARLLEPAAPSPRSRLRMIRALTEAGVETGAFVMPILPGITDAPAEIRSLLRGIARSGASFSVADVARILGPAWISFEQTLIRHFPHLRGAYARLARNAGRFDAETIDRIGERFRRIRAEEELDPKPGGDGERADHPGIRPGGWAGDLFGNMRVEPECEKRK